MKIVLNAEPLGYSPKAIRDWKSLGYKYVASSWEEIMRTKAFKNVSVLIVRLARKVDDEVLSRFPDLDTVVSATTGHDHLDLDNMKARKVRLVSLRGQDRFLKTIPSTAEHTLALLLAIVRNIPAANDHVRSGRWERDPFRGAQLQGKTLGIVGLGRIGGKVAKYAKALGMEVQYYDPFVSASRYKKCRSLEQVMSTSDIVSIHVHLTEQTENLINKKTLRHIKNAIYLINTSRGKIVDEKAVVEFLEDKKKILGVAVDVLSTELETLRKSPLWNAQQRGSNVVITPHVGGATWDAMWACEEFMVKLM